MEYFNIELKLCTIYQIVIQCHWFIQLRRKNTEGGFIFQKDYKNEKVSVVEYPLQAKLITFVGEYNDGLRQGSWRIKKDQHNVNHLIKQSKKRRRQIQFKGLQNGSWIEKWNFKMSCLLSKGENIKMESDKETDDSFQEKLRRKKIRKNLLLSFYMLDTNNKKQNKGHGTSKLSINKKARYSLFFALVQEQFLHNIIVYVNQFRAGCNQKYGIKIGKWVELDEFYHYKFQILYEGEYTNDIKQGKWEMMKHHNQNLKRLGGGWFIQNGLKNHRWIEPDLKDKFWLRFVEYQNGKDIVLIILFN
ncbi:unnamed protein product [Paramecium octaurelia]|uniref:Uncharacterized protein n=1 Tax=Paramecium octaurelia TaxID=43137 RepID=A0A8S1Y0U5_PAROT|nr:unnamed protein product [Paramecium octaurelia]